MSNIIVRFNKTELNINKEILQKSEYFNFILENSPQNIIEINNPDLSILGFKYVLDILENKTTVGYKSNLRFSRFSQSSSIYQKKYQKELQYFEIQLPDNIIYETQIKVILNNIEFKIKKEILRGPRSDSDSTLVEPPESTYFKEKIEEWDKNTLTSIIINDPKISYNGFLYIIDLLSNKINEIKKEYITELDFFKIPYQIEEEPQESQKPQIKESYTNIISNKNTPISSSGVIDLVAFGMQDHHMENENQFTLLTDYHNSYGRYAQGYYTNTFSGNINFGTRITTTISRNIDIIENFEVLINLPPLPNGYVWKNKVGLKIIKNANLNIGGQEIISISNKYLEAEYNLYTPENKKIHELVLDLDYDKRKELSKHPITLIIPLHFIRPNYNNTDDSLKRSLPLISMSFHNIDIGIRINELPELIEIPPNCTSPNVNIINMSMLIEGICLDGELRNNMGQQGHEIQINQIQESNESFSSGEVPHYNIIKHVHFNHPCKDIIFIVYNRKTEELSDDLETIILQINGHDRFIFSAQLAKNLYPKKYLGIEAPKGYYYYSFCKDPYNTYDGNNTINFSRLDVVTFKFETKVPVNHDITIITTNFNFLRIMGGMVGIVYAT